MSMVPLNDCASVVGSDDSPNSVIVFLKMILVFLKIFKPITRKWHCI
jgi:hypothetical protein